jgi:hypothetical protein
VHTEVSVARQSPRQPQPDEPDTKIDEPATERDDADGTEPTKSASADRSLWERVRIDPVEIALPSGVGYTLRAYRPADELTPTDVTTRDEDDPFAGRNRRHEVEEDDDETVVILDEEVAAQFAEEEADDRSGKDGKTADRPETVDAGSSAEDEEVPIFLSHQGRLLLFKTPESLVAFVRSGAPHDLAQLDTWATLVERIEPADIAPLDEDSYELDLVVENLRGGHDVWSPNLIIPAGEVARDLAYALRLPSVLEMLSPGSSLDDLDEALRATTNGGLGAFLGRRKLKKIGAQTASLGWRTIIGKISSVVDWRD